MVLSLEGRCRILAQVYRIKAQVCDKYSVM